MDRSRAYGSTIALIFVNYMWEEDWANFQSKTNIRLLKSLLHSRRLPKLLFEKFKKEIYQLLSSNRILGAIGLFFAWYYSFLFQVTHDIFTTVIHVSILFISIWSFIISFCMKTSRKGTVYMTDNIAYISRLHKLDIVLPILWRALLFLLFVIH